MSLGSMQDHEDGPGQHVISGVFRVENLYQRNTDDVIFTFLSLDVEMDLTMLAR